MFLSFIIPVYNAGNYVERCFASITKQIDDTIECEVLLIDDGSSDGTADICRGLTTRHKYVQFIPQKHFGTSTARNTGLDRAQGDYIWMVDADDTIAANAIQCLYNFAKSHHYPEVIRFNYSTIINRQSQKVIDKKNGTISPAIEYLIGRTRSYVWEKIYRHDVIQNIRFPDGISHLEDTYFDTLALRQSSTIILIPDLLYNYHCNNDKSATRNHCVEALKKNLRDTLKVHRLMIADINACSDSHTLQVLKETLNINLVANLYSLFRRSDINTMREVINLYRTWGVYPIHRTKSIKANWFLSIANHSRALYACMKACQWISAHSNH